MIVTHAAAVSVALVVGAVILLRPKGTQSHRVLGWVYVTGIAVTVLASFGIYEINEGTPSVFHVVSVLVLLVVTAGLVAIRRLANQRLHLLLMLVSYLMTVVTGVSQFFGDLPFASEAMNAIVFLQLPSILGFILIWRTYSRHEPIET